MRPSSAFQQLLQDGKFLACDPEEQQKIAEFILYQEARNNKFIAMAYYKNEGKGNLGDELSPYIVSKISGKSILHVHHAWHGKLCAIGSIIGTATLSSTTTFWGTGTHIAKIPRQNAQSRVSFRAVRGPVTRAILKDAGYECPAIYGDPALLWPHFWSPKVEKRCKLGIIPHYVHQGLLNIQEEVKFIDILRDPEELEDFARELLQCEAVLSSSLHGIIVANSFGIPARYFQIPGSPLSGDEGLKFIDYFKSVGMPVQKPLILEQGTIVDEGFLKHIDKTVDLKIDLELLQEVFPYDILW